MNSEGQTRRLLAEALAEAKQRIAEFEEERIRREHAEEALKQSERLHRVTMENILDPVFITDDAGRFTFICPNLPHILGYTLDELYDSGNIASLVGPALFDFRELEARGELRNIETAMVDKDGRERSFLCTVKQVCIQGGTVLHTFHEITERKLAESEREAAFEALQESQGRLEELSERLVQAQEMERRALARELHDDIGQVLTSIKLNLQAIKDQTLDSESVDRVSSVLDAVDGAIRRVQRISQDLRPSVLDDLGLVPALRSLVGRDAQHAPFDVSFYATPFKGRLPPELETAYFRIAQEAITNVMRHAEATHLSVALKIEEDVLVLSVQDDGKGFDVEAVFNGTEVDRSLGLLGMHERAHLIGGVFTINSTPGQGTEIWVRTPLGCRPERQDREPLNRDFH
jgi:PAS domain S-box-containing protein